MTVNTGSVGSVHTLYREIAPKSADSPRPRPAPGRGGQRFPEHGPYGGQVADGSSPVRRGASDAHTHRISPTPTAEGTTTPDGESPAPRPVGATIPEFLEPVPAEPAATRPDTDSPVSGGSGPEARTGPDTVGPAEQPDDSPAQDDTPPAILLREPREGIPVPVADPAALADLVTRFAAGHGPVAIDAERASGYRYTQRAYLIQLRRDGAGTALIDPIPLAAAGTDLSGLTEAIAETEWVLHAASQDLPCLAEVGMRPRHLFDTELAARLAGFERVGLAAITERLLGYALEKHHSAADWSTRPLPESWLAYAALDVELLVALRDELAAELARQGKDEWAAQEFAALVSAGPARPRTDPWRRTSGIHRVRGARGLSRVRALWTARDEVAMRRDTAPGRVLPDAAIIAAAQADPKDEPALMALPGFGNRGARRLTRTWLSTLQEVRTLAEPELPSPSVSTDGPPPAHRWAERDPAAATRLARCRAVVSAIAREHHLPAENLLTPDTVRRLAWDPPAGDDPAAVGSFLVGHGARAWQIELTAVALGAALAEAAAGHRP